MTTRTFRRLFPPAVPAEGSAFWLLFHGVDLLMPSDGLPLLVGVLAADAPTPAGYLALGLRGVLAHGDAELIGLASYATHLTHWNRTSHFCPTCGLPLNQLSDASWGRGCANGHTLYPPVSPATIVLIHDGE